MEGNSPNTTFRFYYIRFLGFRWHEWSVMGPLIVLTYHKRSVHCTPIQSDLNEFVSECDDKTAPASNSNFYLFLLLGIVAVLVMPRTQR